jgi:hypothetical protein
VVAMLLVGQYERVAAFLLALSKLGVGKSTMGSISFWRRGREVDERRPATQVVYL